MVRRIATVTVCLAMFCVVCSGCSTVGFEDSFHYDSDGDYDYSDVGAVESTQSVEDSLYQHDVNYDIGEEKQKFIIINETMKLYHTGNTFSKSHFLFNSTDSGIANLTIKFLFNDGRVEEVCYSKTDLAFQHSFSLPIVDGVVSGVSVTIHPCDKSYEEFYNFDEEGPLRQMSGNTVESTVSGVLECYDNLGNNVLSIPVQRGKEYVIDSTTVIYGLIYGE